MRMTLREFKKKNKLKLEEMAAELDLSVSHVSDLITGRRGASLDVAVRIEDYTKGKVSCRDMLATFESAR